MINKESLISNIPSTTLVDAINKENFDISEYDLFKTLYLYSKNIEDRIEITKYFLNNGTDEKNKKIASTLLDNLLIGFNNFKTPEKDCVYDLIIKEFRCNAEHYLDYSYDKSIDKLHQLLLCNYVDDGYDTCNLELSLKKRKIGVQFKDNNADDEVESIFFNEYGEPDNLFFYKDDHWSYECEDFTDKYWWPNLKLPLFFKEGDLVKLNYKKGLNIDNLGVVLYNQKDYRESIAYVIPLDSKLIKNRNAEYEENGINICLEHHRHIPFVELTVVNPKILKIEDKKHYDYFISFYQNYQRKTK